MPIHNADVSKIFNQVADLLEIEGANQYRVRAYRNAARTITNLSQPVADLIEKDEDLAELPDIGADLAAKIEEIVKTGSLAQLEEIEQRTPLELTEMLKISGLGPKRVQAIYRELEVTRLDELEDAARNGRIQSVEGIGEQTEQTILDEIKRGRETEQRLLLRLAEEFAKSIVEYLQDFEDVEHITVAGSYRRRKETVGDLDILAIGDEGEKIIQHFAAYEDVEEIVSQGETRSTVRLRSGLQVDLRVVAQESYGAALFYFTGSKAHNLALRNMALAQDLKINEYGVFDGEERIAGATEEEIYAQFDLPYIVPELREDRGEFEAARQGQLPTLLTLDDLRGDLHVHTQASDGKATLEEMASAAQEREYEYLAITDHSAHVGVTQGLDADKLARRIDEIERVNEQIEGITLLKGIEADILEDGSLALPDDILAKLDLTVCSVHTKFDLSGEKQTERIIRAMDNPHFNILAHPTGRRIGERPPYEVNLERVMEAAVDRGCFLEINAQPDRLDLNDVYAKMAAEIGVKIAISTDAHRVEALNFLHFGVDQARRAWLTKEDTLNTRRWQDLKDLLKR